MNDQTIRRLLFLATVLSVVLCVGGCERTATLVEDGKTVFTFPISFLAFRTMFCLLLGIVCLLVLIIGPIITLVEMLRVHSAPSARKQEPAEQTSTGTKPDEDGNLCLLYGVLFGLLVGSYSFCDLGQRIHSGFNDKVILSDSGFTSDVWIWFEPHRQQYSFKDIRAIRTWQKRSSAKVARLRCRATITLKSGEQEAIPVNDLLRRAWPEIARKAIANGIHIEGDF